MMKEEGFVGVEIQVMFFYRPMTMYEKLGQFYCSKK